MRLVTLRLLVRRDKQSTTPTLRNKCIGNSKYEYICEFNIRYIYTDNMTGLTYRTAT